MTTDGEEWLTVEKPRNLAAITLQSFTRLIREDKIKARKFQYRLVWLIVNHF